jgi:hypothetical protein
MPARTTETVAAPWPASSTQNLVRASANDPAARQPIARASTPPALAGTALRCCADPSLAHRSMPSVATTTRVRSALACRRIPPRRSDPRAARWVYAAKEAASVSLNSAIPGSHEVQGSTTFAGQGPCAPRALGRSASRPATLTVQRPAVRKSARPSMPKIRCSGFASGGATEGEAAAQRAPPVSGSAPAAAATARWGSANEWALRQACKGRRPAIPRRRDGHRLQPGDGV